MECREEGRKKGQVRRQDMALEVRHSGVEEIRQKSCKITLLSKAK
jgi:hypothetical protein